MADDQNKIINEIPQRVERAIGPVAAGMILDFADFMTFGRIGIYFGFTVGFLVGWYLTKHLKTPPKWRGLVCVLAGIYCMVPGTELFPLATILGAFSRFFEKPPKEPKE